MPWKPPCWVTFGLGDPGITRAQWQPAADWEAARFSTSELEKAALGIILGTVSHENLQEWIREAIKSKTMYFEMNQAGETPCSLPQPQNWEFFPDEVNLSILVNGEGLCDCPATAPFLPLPTPAEHLLHLLGHVMG